MMSCAASCSTVVSDCLDHAPDDLDEELSFKEIELLLLHQKYELLCVQFDVTNFFTI